MPIAFTNNSAPNGYGGAVYNFVNNPSGGGLSIFNISGDFQGNNASYGGAVANQIEGGNGIDTFTLNGSFTGNVALQNGGAVVNYMGLSGNAPYGNTNIFDFTGVISFNNNVAVNGSGGAIYNYINAGGETGETNLGTGVVFSGNSAANGKGGAIYNYGQTKKDRDGGAAPNNAKKRARDEVAACVKEYVGKALLKTY